MKYYLTAPISIFRCPLSTNIIIGVFLLYNLLTLPYTHVNYIKLKTYKKSDIFNSINYFNNLVGYEIISLTKGIRLVSIIEDDKELSKISPKTIGITRLLPWGCRIVIHSNLEQDELNNVIFHELFGHCLFFGHDNSNEFNIMNSEYSGHSTSKTKEFAKQVKDRVLFWKL